MNPNSSQKLVLSKKSLSKESSSSSSTPMKQNFPALPVPIRFAPMTPRPRPPFSSTYSSIISPTTTSTQKSINKPSTSKFSKSDTEPIPYIKNPYHHMIKLLEPCEIDKVNESFLSLINYLFPRDCHFFNDEYKTREYYQTILIDTDSIIIEHNMNSRDPSKIDFSKVRIKRILTPEEWGSRPYIKKTLDNFPTLPYFTYYDYQEAWYKTFLLRNFNHSWFIFFDKDFSNNYPLWFVKWFQYMGIIPEAFPPLVLEAFNKFKKYFEKDGTPLFEYTLQFVCVLRLPWIMSWTYHYQEAQTAPLSPPALYRHYRVKWWNKFPIEKAGTQAVDEYYKLCYQAPIQRTIKGESSDIVSRIQAACSSPEEIQKIINEIKNSTSGSSNNDQEQFQDAQDPYDDVILSL